MVGRAARPTSLGCVGGKPRSLLSATHLCLSQGPPACQGSVSSPWGDGGGAEAGEGAGSEGRGQGREARLGSLQSQMPEV